MLGRSALHRIFWKMSASVSLSAGATYISAASPRAAHRAPCRTAEIAVHGHGDRARPFRFSLRMVRMIRLQHIGDIPTRPDIDQDVLEDLDQATLRRVKAVLRGDSNGIARLASRLFTHAARSTPGLNELVVVAASPQDVSTRTIWENRRAIHAKGRQLRCQAAGPRATDRHGR